MVLGQGSAEDQTKSREVGAASMRLGKARKLEAGCRDAGWDIA